MTTTWTPPRSDTATNGTDGSRSDLNAERTLTPLALDLDRAHDNGVVAAAAGLQDPALGANRLTGTAVHTLAEAAISSATPFLRAPLLGRLSRVLQLHPKAGRDDGRCPTCDVPAPCDTAVELRW